MTRFGLVPIKLGAQVLVGTAVFAKLLYSAHQPLVRLLALGCPSSPLCQCLVVSENNDQCSVRNTLVQDWLLDSRCDRIDILENTVSAQKIVLAEDDAAGPSCFSHSIKLKLISLCSGWKKSCSVIDSSSVLSAHTCGWEQVCRPKTQC